MHKAESEEVRKEELLAQLGYVVNVLDSAFSDESKSANVFACCNWHFSYTDF